MTLRTLPLLALLFAPLARAGVTEQAYARGVGLIQRLYLHPDDVDGPKLLQSSARALADHIDWLMVEPAGDAVHLRHGDGTPIGSVSVANLDTLPDALRALEQVVRDAGYPIDPELDLRLAIVEGLTDALDRHSRVLEGDGLERFDVRLKGTLVGIGATLELLQGHLTVGELVPDGPAALGGMKTGDVIERIDDRATTNITLREATQQLRGELGSEVRLDLLRGEERVQLTLKRAEVVVPNVTHKVLAGKVGYVAVDHFSQRTVQNLDASLVALRAAGALDHGLVIDLRGNTGGSMKEAARSADRFVDKGLLIRTVGPDGGQVQNLQSHMEAIEEPEDLNIPVAFLVDERTASGSEIFAGALLELDRAVLVGTRSYGKGTVQKIYNLDPSSRLKLTVAQYLLANDRAIDGAGLVPDVVIRPIDLDSYGARFRAWGPTETGVPLAQIVPYVHEATSWRGEKTPQGDSPLELARRAVLQATGPGRDATLASLQAAAAELRLEEEQHLAEALAAHAIDWSLPDDPLTDTPSAPLLRVSSAPDPDHPDGVLVRVTATNPGDHPLHRVLVQLTAPNYSVWDGLIVPIGLVPAQGEASGQVSVPLRPGVLPREDEVSAVLHAAEPLAPATQSVVLGARSGVLPQLAVTAHLVRDASGARAVVDVHNLSRPGVVNLDLHFGFPGDTDVELVDASARVPLLLGGQSEQAELALAIGPDAPAVLPLRLKLECEHYGDLVSWPLALPVDGSSVTLQAPALSTPGRALAAPVGRYDLKVDVSDDRAIAHVVAWSDGQKVGWWGDHAAIQHLIVPIDLHVGENTVVLRAQDDQGLSADLRVVIRGEAEATVDAAPER